MVNVKAIDATLELMRKARAHQFVMANYFVHPENCLHVDNCGTAACIAGWTTLAHFKTHKQWTDDDQFLDSFDTEPHTAIEFDIFAKVTEVLALEPARASALFYMNDVDGLRFKKLLHKHGITMYDTFTVDEVSDPLAAFDHLPAKIRKMAAINVLERLKATGEVDWLGAIDAALEETNSTQATFIDEYEKDADEQLQFLTNKS